MRHALCSLGLTGIRECPRSTFSIFFPRILLGLGILSPLFPPKIGVPAARRVAGLFFQIRLGLLLFAKDAALKS